MSATIKDVAKAANVSPSTVSRVIADHPKISDETKKRVLAAMKKLNYHPNAIARSLANKSTKTLGLLLPNTDEDLFNNPFFTQAMRGISIYAQKKGYYIMYSYSNNEAQEIEFIKRYIHSKWVDGIILLSAKQEDQCIEYLKNIHYPFVVVGRPKDTHSVLWVDNDNFQAMYNVVTSLIERGYRDIAFIGGPQSFIVTNDRLEGYKRALQGRGIEVDENYILTSEFSEQGGYEGAKKIIEYKVPEAIVTTDDLIAFGVLKAIKENDKQKIAVIGFNNTFLAPYQSPSLSSVDINAEQIGYQAAKLLIDHLEDKEEEEHNKPTHYIVDTKFIERESTKL
ncbi:LacI family DNA-binding transcriptional regulator [Defluviitalea saccharophila]|uniref:LacI family DNA-binding transcriptional regulator n=1 Tax=Defluviitalea saccharophila TaxID=879970 RepID=A0ABZ2Y4A0_9FIRM